MNVKVKIMVDDAVQGFKQGAEGFVHGYLPAAGQPCAVIICKNKIVVVPVHYLIVIPS